MPRSALLLLGLLASARAADLGDGLVHYWSFDAATQRDGRYGDLMGTDPLLAEGPVQGAAGRFGEAVGGTGWCDGGELAPTTDLTLSAWVRCEDGGDQHQTIASLGNRARWTFQIDGGKLSLTGGDGPGVVARDALPRGGWVHVAATAADVDRAPGGEKRVVLSCDGVEVATGALAWDAAPEHLVVLQSHRGGGNALHGALDELAVWDRALTPAEIAMIHASEKPLAALLGPPQTVWATVDPTAPAEHGRVPATFRVQREEATGDLRVQLAWSGWADAADYDPPPTQVTIPAGRRETTIALRPVDDAIPEGRESVIMSILDGAAYRIRADGRDARTRIVDDDWAGVPTRTRTVYAHYMGCFCAGASAIQWHATSGLATMDAPDWATKRTPAIVPDGGEGMLAGLVAWARGSIGGTYRNFALAPYDRALPLEQAADLEIRRAIRMGIDGFTFDAWAGGAGAMELFDLMIGICEQKDYPFALTITPDATCLDANLPALAPYPGDPMRKTVKWLIDRHGRSPKLARRDGKPLIMAYGAQWPWVSYVWEVAGAKVGAGKPKEDYEREVQRLRTCPEGWKLMREAYRRIEHDVGAEIAWEMDLSPSLFGYGVSDFGAGVSVADATLAAAKVVAPDFPVIGQFLGDQSTPALARAVIAAKSEWGGSPFLQYENYAWCLLASPGTDWLRAGWEDARMIPATCIQLITWNDYHEATNVSPGYNTRYAYSDLTGQLIRAWKADAEPTSDRDRVYIFSHKYVHDAKVFPFQARPIADNVIEVLAILPKPARLRSPGRTAIDGSTEWDAPAGMSWKQFPLTAGPVAAELLREGKVELRVDCPEPVSDRPFRPDIGKVGACSEDQRQWREDFGDIPYFVYSEYGDVDGDGLPNWFEMLYFGKWGDLSTAGVADPDGDPDGDGKTNLEEWRDQTDPTDPAS